MLQFQKSAWLCQTQLICGKPGSPCHWLTPRRWRDYFSSTTGLTNLYWRLWAFNSNQHCACLDTTVLELCTKRTRCMVMCCSYYWWLTSIDWHHYKHRKVLKHVQPIHCQRQTVWKLGVPEYWKEKVLPTYASHPNQCHHLHVCHLEQLPNFLNFFFVIHEMQWHLHLVHQCCWDLMCYFLAAFLFRMAYRWHCFSMPMLRTLLKIFLQKSNGKYDLNWMTHSLYPLSGFWIQCIKMPLKTAWQGYKSICKVLTSQCCALTLVLFSVFTANFSMIWFIHKIKLITLIFLIVFCPWWLWHVKASLRSKPW